MLMHHFRAIFIIQLIGVSCKDLALWFEMNESKPWMELMRRYVRVVPRWQRFYLVRENDPELLIWREWSYT